MCGRHELVELGERVAEDGVHRHEKTLQGLAATIAPYSPGAAAVLADSSAPEVLRQRALGVAVDVVLRTTVCQEEFSEPENVNQVDAELQHLLLDWQGQLVGWGA